MKVAIGCDHGGINLKPVLVDYLEKKGMNLNLTLKFLAM